MATLTNANKVYASFAVTKSYEDDDGNMVVIGKATDGSVDSDRQIIDPAWSAEALKTWMSTGANIRVQHQARRDPAGKGIDLAVDRDGDGGHWLKALVVEPVAKELVKHGVLRAFSVGISNPIIDRDMTGKAAGGIIRGGPETSIFEVSLVDRPANKSCGFTLAKAAGDGAEDEWEDFGDLEAALYEARSSAIDKGEAGASPDSEDDSTDDDTDDADGDMDDEDAKKAYREARAAWKAAEPSLSKIPGPTEFLQSRAAYKGWLAQGDALGVADDLFGTPTGKALFVAKRNFDASVGGGVDRDKIPAEDFAGPNRSYPIVTPGDVQDAASLVGHADNPDAVKAKIIAIAKRKGEAFVAQLPKAWNVKAEDPEDVLEKAKGKKKPAFQGAAEPFDGKDKDGDGQDADKPMKKVDEPAEAAEKAGGKTCKGCGKVYHMDTKVSNCTQCGKKLPKGKAIKSEDLREIIVNLDGAKSLSVGDIDALVKQLGDQLDKGKKRPLPADTKPAGEHREPDGSSTVEQLEPQAGMSTDTDPVKDKVPASVKDSEPVSYSVKRMHDVFCAAYHEDDVRAEYPSLKSLGDAADEVYWAKLMKQATDAGDPALTAEFAAMVAGSQYLKGADPLALADGRALLHKSFTDMYPNTDKPSPTSMTPGKFQRPYLSAGHSPATATGAGPRVPPSTHTPEPQDFHRGLITSGHEADSPANKGQNNPNGYNARDYYGPAARDAAMNWMKSVHDRLTLSLPDLCPMAPSRAVMPPDLSAGSVPHAASMPQTYSAPGEKSADGGEVVTLLKALLEQGKKSTKKSKVEKALRQENRELQAQLDKLGSQLDPAEAPVRGVVRKSAVFEDEAAPVERRSLVDEAHQRLNDEREAEIAYATRQLKSGNPAMRQRAEMWLEKLLVTPNAEA